MELSIASLPMPIRLRPETALSDEALLHFSAENDGLRVEREPNGDLLVMVATGGRTGLLNRRILQFLGNWADEDGRGQVFDSSTGFKLASGAVRMPDASWVSNARWNALTEAEQDGLPRLCPEFVIELSSPTDRIPTVKKKIVEEWIPNGAELAWLIDPKARRVTVYRRGQKPEVHENPSSVQGSGCVAGFELVMQRVWG